jgi:hypothetical protein
MHRRWTLKYGMNSEAWDECSDVLLDGTHFALRDLLFHLLWKSWYERESDWSKSRLSSQAVCFLDLSLHEYLFVFCWGLGTCNNNPILQQKLFFALEVSGLYMQAKDLTNATHKDCEFLSFLRILIYKSSRLLHNRNNHVTNVLPVHQRNNQKQEKSDFPMSCCEASWQESKPF